MSNSYSFRAPTGWTTLVVMTLPRTLRRPSRLPSRLPSRRLALTGALLALPGLTACGGDDIASGLAERAVEEAGGGDVDVEVGDDGESFSITDGEGNTVASGQGLPDGFPDQVPLIEEEILSGVSAGGASGEGWAVTMLTDRPAAEVLEEATGLLEGAGFSSEGQGSMSMGELQTVQLTDGTWQVSLSVIDADGEVTVQYLVAPAAS